MSIYKPLHERLCRFVQTLVWNEEDAKDISSEVVLIAYEQFHKLRDEKAMLAYLFAIASNLIRQRQRTEKFKGLFNFQQAVNRPTSSSGEDAIMRYELNQALNKLPSKQREAIVWYEISGLTIDEIANIHQLSISGVKTNIHRARKQLQLLLEQQSINSKQKKGV